MRKDLVLLTRFACPLGLLLVGAVTAETGEIRIEGDFDDPVVQTATVTLNGTVDPPGLGDLQLIFGGQTLPASPLEGTWRAEVPLQEGLNRIRLNYGETSRELVVTRARLLIARPQQRFRIVWREGADDELEEIARATLSAPLGLGDLSTFVAGVRARVPTVILRAFGRVANLALVEEEGADVYTLEMVPVDLGGFGETPGPLDCGNRRLGGTSSISVTFFRLQMERNLDSDWRPMRKGDPLQVRIEDVAEAIGRTAAHELGHAMGLVAEPGSLSCGWMNGCDGAHNCEDFQRRNPGVLRFGGGLFLMDPGPSTPGHLRIAEPEKSERGASRIPASLDNLSRSYLSMIQPLP